MDKATRVQFLDEAVYISNSLEIQPVYEKRSSEFKPVKLCLKIDLVSHPGYVEGLGKHILLLEIDLLSHPGYVDRLNK